MTPLTPRVPAHVATTRHLCAAYPLVSEVLEREEMSSQEDR